MYASFASRCSAPIILLPRFSGGEGAAQGCLRATISTTSFVKNLQDLRAVLADANAGKGKFSDPLLH